LVTGGTVVEPPPEVVEGAGVVVVVCGPVGSPEVPGMVVIFMLALGLVVISKMLVNRPTEHLLERIY
jgi:hypothetical protein